MSQNLYHDFHRTDPKEQMTKTDNINTTNYFIDTVDLRDPKWDCCIKNKNNN